MANRRAVASYLYNRILQDAGLKGILGNNFQLYMRLPEINPSFPFVVYRVVETGNDDGVLTNALLYISTYSHGRSETVASQAAERLKVILDRLVDSTKEVPSIQVYSNDDVDSIATDSDQVHRLDQSFRIVYARVSILEGIASRE